MFKALKDCKIIAISETKEIEIATEDGKVTKEVVGEDLFPCMVFDEVVEDTEHTCEDYIQYDGEYVLQEDYPIDARNEEIRRQRQARYEAESDPIRLDYDEALAREQDNAEELRKQWLASKDKIREELPYVVGE